MTMFRPTPTGPLTTFMPRQIEIKLLIDALFIAITAVWAFTIIGTLIAMAPNFPLTEKLREKVIAATRPSVESDESHETTRSTITRKKCTAWAKKPGKIVQ